MAPSIKMTDCPTCGCGCAQVGVTCGCCGHFQFIPGDPWTIQSQFYNYELTCAFCGVTWRGHQIDLNACPTPWDGNGNTFYWLGGGTFYRYIGAYSKWYETDDLNTAIQNRTMGTIYDNCGNAVPIVNNG